MEKIAIARFGHQGDVLFMPLEEEPDLTGFVEQKEPVLAYGEVTGHSHRILAEPGVKVRFFKGPKFDLLYIDPQGAPLSHEEHGVPRLGGWSKIKIQREKSLEDAGWRRVVD